MTLVLGIHNILRWAVLFAALFVLYRMGRGMFTKPTWEKTDRLAGMVYTIGLDLQLLLGLILYFVLSPSVKSFIANFSTAVENQALRFWGLDHIGMMLAAVVLGHIGGAVAKKQIPDQEKFNKSALFFALSLILLLAGIPWFRPLIPVF